MRWALVASVGLTAILSGYHPATAYQITPKAQRETAFLHAIRGGDAKDTMQLAAQMHMPPFVADLYRDRLLYRLPALLGGAKACRDAHYPHAVHEAAARIVRTCEHMVIGAAYQLGAAREYFGALAWQRRLLERTRKADAGASDTRSTSPQVNYARLAASIPPYRTRIVSSRPTVLDYPDARMGALKPAHSDDTRSVIRARATAGPRVKVIINGHPVIAKVDTGQDTAIMLSASTAKKVGLRRLDSGTAKVSEFGYPAVPSRDVSLSLIRHLQLGSLRVSNLMAIVVPDEYAGGEIGNGIIGLPLLGNFNDVSFNRSSMVINPNPLPCAHQVSATYAIGGDVGGIWVFDAEADGRSIKATMDTGARVALVAGKALLGGATFSASPSHSGRPQDVVAERYLSVSAAGYRFTSDHAPMVPSLAFPDVLIGAPNLARMSVRFSFHPTPSLCFRERPSAGSDDAQHVGY